MNMIIGYIHEGAYERLQAQLEQLGLEPLAMAISSCQIPGEPTRLTYRGVRLLRRLERVARVEVVAASEDVALVVDALLRGPSVGEVFVIDAQPRSLAAPSHVARNGALPIARAGAR